MCTWPCMGAIGSSLRQSRTLLCFGPGACMFSIGTWLNITKGLRVFTSQGFEHVMCNRGVSRRLCRTTSPVSSLGCWHWESLPEQQHSQQRTNSAVVLTEVG